MSDEKDNGGPAFPTQESSEYNGQRSQYAEPGMTLRDYFAAKAMQGLMTNKMYDHDTPEMITQKAYDWADMILKARNS